MERDGRLQAGGIGAVWKEDIVMKEGYDTHQELLQRAWDDITGEDLTATK